MEIVLSTNSGQIGILPNHAPLLAALDMGVSKIRTDGNGLQWLRWAQAELAEAEGRRRNIEANLTFKRAKARLEASTTV
ncbi:hypothetical protein L7F22_046790 [Adiantum nelumboides]|nr:hypothetical protein [Adiantum nelumboides]